MSAQVYSPLGQTERERKAFFEGTSIDLSCKLSLTYGGNANRYASVHHSLPTLRIGIGNALAVFKTNQ